MKYKPLQADSGRRLFAAVFEVDDEVCENLQHLCEREGVTCASLSGIGGFRGATLAFYDMQSKRYEPIAVDEQVECLSLLGNVTQYEHKPKIHAHCIVGHRDGRTSGGHLLSAVVRPTLELLVAELPGALARTDRPEIGIPLIDL